MTLALVFVAAGAFALSAALVVGGAVGFGWAGVAVALAASGLALLCAGLLIDFDGGG